MISIQKVDKYFGDYHALCDINIDVPQGQVVIVLGPSGSGKSTLCRTINRLETIDSGEIHIDGHILPEEGKQLAKLREEVGMDPTRGDGGRSYGRRVADLVRAGRTYVVMEAGRVVFKADVGAVFGPVAQIHGVWVRPDRRSHGLGRTAMAELATLVRRDHAPQVSLYVNAYNEAARRAYAAAGYRQVGELSTILF